MRTDQGTRLQAARIARRLLNMEMDPGSFLKEFPDADIDDDIDELLDQLEHEPKVGGLLGVSKGAHRAHFARTIEIIECLEGDK